MLKEIDTAFAELEVAIDNFCREGEKEEILITFNDAWELALNYPDKVEMREAVKLVKQLEQYFESNGKIHYEQAKRKIEKLLLATAQKSIF